ncbi:lipoyl(octanoyl) transferase LipB [Pinisolibacter sp.]|mgnify:FL=1|uniref:lipoyl(octanoyl) transferase LipB n=1 Tax=Pinisolibacter sp. TaxID=2172024 RepID=UPI002FDE27E5
MVNDASRTGADPDFSRSTRDDLAENTLFPAREGSAPVEWLVEDGLLPYPEAVAEMEDRVGRIARGEAAERVWLVEHPPLYTAGTSAQAADLLEPERFPVFPTGRGGEYTYHGPGQRVAYVMLDLTRRRQDVRAFVAALEQWVIATLWAHHVRGERREDRVGVWVRRPEKPQIAPGVPAEDKIAAIGIRVRRWVTFHGLALNVEPDLSHFGGIVPCGIHGHGVTSLVDLGLPVTMSDVDVVMKREFEAIFGPTVAVFAR